VAHPQIAAFARLANGGVKPTRNIYGQNTLFTRTIHDMAYDSVRHEILVPSLYAGAILIFRGDADGNVAPVRKIYGPKTTLGRTSEVAVDGVHGEIFVPQRSPGNPRILVFPTEADGDVAPLRILEGLDRGMQRLTIDPVRDFLMVSGEDGIRIYDRRASGNTRPLRFIRSALPVTLMTTIPSSGMIVASVGGFANDSAETEDLSGRFALTDYVGVWSVYDDGDVPPRFTIGGPNLVLKDLRGVAVDPKNQNIIASDKTINGILTFHVPEVFVPESGR
jgi:hypothetical protein